MKMVLVKCIKRNDDCQYIWDWLGRNGNDRRKEKRRYISCPACGYRIRKDKAIQAYKEMEQKKAKSTNIKKVNDYLKENIDIKKQVAILVDFEKLPPEDLAEHLLNNPYLNEKGQQRANELYNSISL